MQGLARAALVVALCLLSPAAFAQVGAPTSPAPGAAAAPKAAPASAPASAAGRSIADLMKEPPATATTGAPGAATSVDMGAEDPKGRADVASSSFLPGLYGLSGPLRLRAAGGVPERTVSLAIWGQFLTMDDLIVQGDDVTRTAGGFAAIFSPNEFVETSLILRSASNESQMTSPELIQSQGDLSLGVKGFGPLASGFTAGGFLQLDFLTGEGDVFWAFDATSVRLGGMATWDARSVDPTVPLRLHANLGYSLENSRHITDRRLSPSEVFANGVMAYDTIDLSLGAEGLLDQVRPFLEWSLRLPVATRTDTDEICVPSEKCPGNEGFASYPHWLTLGVRGEIFEHLWLSGALDLGLTQTVVSGIAAVPPYNLLFGISYVVDPLPRIVEKPVEKIVTREVAPPKPPEGLVRGRVVDKRSRKPLEGAVVSFPETGKTALSTGADGRFESYAFPPGKLRIEITAGDDYEKKAFLIDLKEGAVEFTFSLVPAAPTLQYEGRVSDLDGMPVPGAQVALRGDKKVYTTDPASGHFRLALRGGPQRIRVTAAGYLQREMDVVADVATRKSLEFSMRPREEMAVSLRDGKLALTQALRFVRGKASLQPASFHLLDQIIDQIVTHDVERLRLDCFTDEAKDGPARKKLSAERGESVKAYLVSQGIAAARIEVRGLGDAPVASALGAKPASSRIEFVVVQSAPGK